MMDRSYVRRRLLVLVPLLAWSFVSGAGSVDAESLRIGAWNIEHLGSPERRSVPGKNNPQKPEDLADYIRSARVDILAMEEIGDTDGADNATYTNSTLNRTFQLLNETSGNDWTYLLFPKKKTEETFQLTGVAWNRAKVHQDSRPYRVPVVDDPDDSLDIWQRQPHAVKFSTGEGRTDVVVIPLHMKSNVGGEAATQKQRGVEAQALVDQLAAIKRRFADDDIVLLGDLNCLKGSEPALARYAAAGWRDLNSADQPTTWRGGNYAPAPFDRILVPAAQTEFAQSKLEVISPGDDDAHREHKTRRSDHLMVVTTVEIGADDD